MAGLPPGFDPATGRLRNVSVPTHINTSYSAPSSSTSNSGGYYRPGFFQRLNNGVASIGNWIDDWVDSACTVVMWIIIIAIAGTAIVGVISLFVEGRIFAAILAIVFGSAIVYYGAVILGYIGWIIAAAVFYSLRYIFWNFWSLLLVLLLAGGIFYWANNPDTFRKTSAETEIVETTSTYRCTAKVLNVRSGPSTSYSTIGRLYRGQTIEVITINDKFAKFHYEGGYGYAGIKYLERVY